MKPFPLRLESYYITELSIKTRTDYKQDTQQLVELLPSDLKVEILPYRHEEERSLFLFVLRLQTTEHPDRKLPYSFQIEMTGHFRYAEDLDTEEAEYIIPTSSPALLYSAAREVLASTTARGIFGELFLPTVGSADLASNILKIDAKPSRKQKKTASKSKSAKSTKMKKSEGRK